MKVFDPSYKSCAYFEKYFWIKLVSTPKTLKKRKPRSGVLRLPKQHRGYSGTQSIVNQLFKLCELSEALSRTS
jgi:hypothetical protein